MAIELCIYLALLVLLLIMMFILPKFVKDNDINIKQNGMTITLTPEEFKKFKENNKPIEHPEDNKLDIYAVNKELDDNIRTVMKNCDDRIKRKVLLGLLDIKVNNENDLDYKLWLFNAGDLRTNEEVMEYNYSIECVKHQKNFNKERHLVNVAAFFIPFLIVFTIVFFAIGIDMWFISIPVALVPAGFAGIIGSIIGYSINISNAKEYGLHDSDPRVQAERTKRGVAIISGVVGAGSTIRHTKKAVKDFSNVDTWKEFK